MMYPHIYTIHEVIYCCIQDPNSSKALDRHHIYELSELSHRSGAYSGDLSYNLSRGNHGAVSGPSFYGAPYGFHVSNTPAWQSNISFLGPYYYPVDAMGAPSVYVGPQFLYETHHQMGPHHHAPIFGTNSMQQFAPYGGRPNMYDRRTSPSVAMATTADRRVASRTVGVTYPSKGDSKEEITPASTAKESDTAEESEEKKHEEERV